MLHFQNFPHKWKFTVFFSLTELKTSVLFKKHQQNVWKVFSGCFVGYKTVKFWVFWRVSSKLTSIDLISPGKSQRIILHKPHKWNKIFQISRRMKMKGGVRRGELEWNPLMQETTVGKDSIEWWKIVFCFRLLHVGC